MTTALEQFEAALPLLTDTLRRDWTTGQGQRVRAIWSLYGGSHPVGLGCARSGLDDKLGRVLGTAITARLEAGTAVEPMLKTVLEEFGELARFEEAAAKIPDRPHCPRPARAGHRPGYPLSRRLMEREPITSMLTRIAEIRSALDGWEGTLRSLSGGKEASAVVTNRPIDRRWCLEAALEANGKVAEAP